MKKTYMAPVTEMINMDITEQLLTVSGGDKNIGYGGVDESGSLEPAGRDDDVTENWTDQLFAL